MVDGVEKVSRTESRATLIRVLKSPRTGEYAVSYKIIWEPRWNDRKLFS